jgi:hypothetical protein
MCRCEGNQEKCDNADADSHTASQVDSIESSDDEEEHFVGYQFPYESTSNETLLAYNAYEVQEEEADNVLHLTEFDMDTDSNFAM